MKRLILIVIAIQLILLFTSLFAKEIEESEKIEKSYRFSKAKATKTVIVDNVNGSIEIIGYTGNEVNLIVRKTIRARSKNKLEQAKDEVRLEISQQDNEIEFYVDGPFRCKDGSINYKGWRRYGYEVIHDFELKLPRDTNIWLKTVNDGEITINKIRSEFEVKNINGGIEMKDIRGSGRIYALNGDVTVDFDQNPTNDCYIGSLNGEIKVYFQKPLSADFRLKTFNGDIYSDFEVTHLPSRQFTKTKKKGKTMYKSDKAFKVKAGNGGPEVELDGFNGDIFILEQKE